MTAFQNFPERKVSNKGKAFCASCLPSVWLLKIISITPELSFLLYVSFSLMSPYWSVVDDNKPLDHFMSPTSQTNKDLNFLDIRLEFRLMIARQLTPELPVSTESSILLWTLEGTTGHSPKHRSLCRSTCWCVTYIDFSSICARRRTFI